MQRLLTSISLAAVLLAAIYLTALAETRAPAAARLSLHAQWTRSIAVNADSAPAYSAHPHGLRGPLLYVLAGNNGSNCSKSDPVRAAVLYALNPSNGKTIWSRSSSGPARCTTAGPVADPSGRWVYAGGFDGKMHRYDAGTGNEYRKGGWPKSVTLMPRDEKMAATPTIAHGYLYATTSGYIGDQDHYQGHLVTTRLSDGTVHVFNSLCSNVRRLLGPTPGASNYCPQVQSGLFGRGQGVSDPINGAVYVVSGNGPWDGRTSWGDTIMKLDPSGNRLLDSYTPTDQAYLNDSDSDLGSTGPALLPTIMLSGHAYHLLVQGGKGPACQGCGGAVLRLLNRDNLSGKGGPGHLGGDLATNQAPGGCEVLTAPAEARRAGSDWVFYTNSCGSAAYRVTADQHGSFHLSRQWSSGVSGTDPVLSGGVLYVAGGDGLRALNAANGSVLWQGNVGDIHWEYPLVTHGHVYVTNNDGKVMAFTISK